MTKTPLFITDTLKPQGPYSPGIRVGEWVFVSGQGPVNHLTGEFENLDITHQTRLTLTNVKLVLEQAGCCMNDVVKATVHLQNINDFEAFNAVYREFFSAPLPARTTVQSILGAGISVEVDAIAIRQVSQG